MVCSSAVIIFPKQLLIYCRPTESGSTAQVVTIATGTGIRYKRPAHLLLFLSAILAGAAVVYADSDPLWELVIAALSFLVLRDGPLIKENMSIKKAVKLNMCLVCVVIYLYLVALGFLMSTDNPPWSHTEEVLYHGIHRLSTLIQVVATLGTGKTVIPVSIRVAL